MCNSYHQQFLTYECTCGFGGSGHKGRTSGNSQTSSSYYDIALENKLKLFVEYFSTTNPNAICKFCGCKIFFYQNSYGSKVFFDELGKPWTKHNCYYDLMDGYEELTLENIPDLCNEKIIRGNNQVAIEPIIKGTLLMGYNIISFTNSKTQQEEEYVINYEKKEFGLCFINKQDGKTTIEGYLDDSKYTIMCYSINEAKTRMNNIFPYKIGEETTIEVFKDNIEKTRIRVYYTLTVVGFNKRPEAFMVLNKIKKETLYKINKSDGIKLKVNSILAKDNTIEFVEIH
jgi:hypothetical protein